MVLLVLFAILLYRKMTKNTKSTQCVCGRHSHLVGAETLGQKMIDGATNGASVAQIVAPLLVAAGLLSAPELLAEGTGLLAMMTAGSVYNSFM